MSDTTIRTYTSDRQRTEHTTERTTEEETDERTDVSVCPECGGTLRTDEAHGETVCADCGLVVDEDGIDRGPEW
ncbi:TFIIB-type zinc ribbon-containing protein, partial [Halarchaeum acidiphilum]|uniref:TFIIB-type zinc ribbon-containing protein n=1 Tax=Halarchaeum acidiphilum TaxID=489138 RepID=UPI002D21BA44